MTFVIYISSPITHGYIQGESRGLRWKSAVVCIDMGEHQYCGVYTW